MRSKRSKFAKVKLDSFPADAELLTAEEARVVVDASRAIRASQEYAPSAVPGRIFEKIYAFLGRPILYGIRKALGHAELIDSHTMEDLRIKATAKALRALPTLKGESPGQIWNWAAKIGENCAIDHLRSEQGNPLQHARRITADPNERRKSPSEFVAEGALAESSGIAERVALMAFLLAEIKRAVEARKAVPRALLSFLSDRDSSLSDALRTHNVYWADMTRWFEARPARTERLGSLLAAVVATQSHGKELILLS